MMVQYMPKPYVIRVSSEKGGVGKTTVSVNVACALRSLKYKVLLVDTDIATPSVGEHLGIRDIEKGYKEILKGEAKIEDILFAYEPLDLKIVLGSSSQTPFNPSAEQITKFYEQITKLDYDFIVIDSPPGFFIEGPARFYDEVAIITTPDTTSCVSSARLARICDKYRIKHRLVVNRSGYNSKFEMSTEEIEKMYGDVIYGMIPEDKIISESLVRHQPAYILNKSSPFSLAIEEICKGYALRIGDPRPEPPPGRKGFFGALAGVFGIK